jgi:hypothetical protein
VQDRFEFFEPDDELGGGKAFAICIHRNPVYAPSPKRVSYVRYRTVDRHTDCSMSMRHAMARAAIQSEGNLLTLSEAAYLAVRRIAPSSENGIGTESRQLDGRTLPGRRQATGI